MSGEFQNQDVSCTTATPTFVSYVTTDSNHSYVTLESCVANCCIAQQEVDQTVYQLKSMSIPLSKQITSAREGHSMIAAIKAHCSWRIYLVSLYTVGIRHSLIHI